MKNRMHAHSLSHLGRGLGRGLLRRDLVALSPKALTPEGPHPQPLTSKALTPQPLSPHGRGEQRNAQQNKISFLMLSPRNPRKQGFTILEVFIAMAILAMAMVALMGSQSQAVKLHDASRNVSLGAMLARQKMNELLLAFKGKDVGEIPEEKKGDFGDAEFAGFKWTMTFKPDEEFEKLGSLLSGGDNKRVEEKVGDELSGMVQQEIKNAGIDPELIAKAIRKVVVTVTWDTGVDTGEYEIWMHLLDAKAQLTKGAVSGPGPGSNPTPNSDDGDE